MAPDDPTSAPGRMRALLPSVKPMPHAAQPEYELSIEMTTGMSAPPIGRMRRTPGAREVGSGARNAPGCKGGGKGDHNADHDVEIAAARSHRRAQAAQRHDEAYRRDEVEEGREVFAHCCVLTLPISS